MRLLLDECLPRKLKRSLSSHDVSTVPEMGWAGVKNGKLLHLAEPLFDVFVTIDGNLRSQQNLRSVNLAFIVLSAVDNSIETLQPLVPQVLVALQTISAGEIVRVGA